MSFKFAPVTKEWRLNNRCDKYPFKITNKNMVTIYAYKAHPDAIIPKIAYGETSACFDITCVETTIIPARNSAVVPNGLRLGIDESESYWMQIQLRSSKGFKYELIPHYGTVDAGYTGDLGVKIYNLGDEDVTIEKGERYAQIAVIAKPQYQIEELNGMEFEEFSNQQQRGSRKFGSSGR
jgi:dUTP pyrophosphatase